jgi:tetratricopeptide (TPR) repeat protein
MPIKKSVLAKANIRSAMLLEKQQDYAGAIKLLNKATLQDPANSQSWNRLMVVYRKSRTPAEEIKLIKTAISTYKKALDTGHKNYITANKKKANSTKELAQMLGLIETNGLPKRDNAFIQRWQTRLHLLEHRMKAKTEKAKITAQKNKAKASKKKQSHKVTK